MLPIDIASSSSHTILLCDVKVYMQSTSFNDFNVVNTTEIITGKLKENLNI